MTLGNEDRATRTLSQAEFDEFAELSGDDNPIHVDPEFAATTPFEVPVAHGMFLYGLARARLACLFPTHVQRHERLVFPAPTPVGTTVQIALDGRSGSCRPGCHTKSPRPADQDAPTGTVFGKGTDVAADTGADTVATRDDGVVVTTTVSHDGGIGLQGHAVMTPAEAVRPTAPTAFPGQPTPQAAASEPAAHGWWAEAIGRRATTSRSFDRDLLGRYARLVDEPNELTAVPEPLLAGMFSRLLGVDLPGPGTNYLKQRLSFSARAPIGHPLVARVEITHVRPATRLVDLATTCTTADGTLVCTGRALVLARGIDPPASARSA